MWNSAFIWPPKSPTRFPPRHELYIIFIPSGAYHSSGDPYGCGSLRYSQQCRKEAKCTYSLSYFANTAPWRLPEVSRGQRPRAYLITFTSGDHRLNSVEFKQALSTHELYQLESNAYLLENTFTKLSIKNLVPGRIRRAIYFIEINL